MSWLCTWWRQVADAVLVLGAGRRCWCWRLLVLVLGAGAGAVTWLTGTSNLSPPREQPAHSTSTGAQHPAPATCLHHVQHRHRHPAQPAHTTSTSNLSPPRAQPAPSSTGARHPEPAPAPATCLHHAHSQPTAPAPAPSTGAQHYSTSNLSPHVHSQLTAPPGTSASWCWVPLWRCRKLAVQAACILFQPVACQQVVGFCLAIWVYAGVLFRSLDRRFVLPVLVLVLDRRFVWACWCRCWWWCWCGCCCGCCCCGCCCCCRCCWIGVLCGCAGGLVLVPVLDRGACIPFWYA